MSPFCGLQGEIGIGHRFSLAWIALTIAYSSIVTKPDSAKICPNLSRKRLHSARWPTRAVLLPVGFLTVSACRMTRTCCANLFIAGPDISKWMIPKDLLTIRNQGQLIPTFGPWSASVSLNEMRELESSPLAIPRHPLGPLMSRRPRWKTAINPEETSCVSIECRESSSRRRNLAKIRT